jgi:hypothetical protein
MEFGILGHVGVFAYQTFSMLVHRCHKFHVQKSIKDIADLQMPGRDLVNKIESLYRFLKMKYCRKYCTAILSVMHQHIL